MDPALAFFVVIAALVVAYVVWERRQRKDEPQPPQSGPSLPPGASTPIVTPPAPPDERPAQPPPPVPPLRASLLESYASLSALLADAEALQLSFAVSVDGVERRGGFGPAYAYHTQLDGSVTRTQPEQQPTTTSPPLPPSPPQAPVVTDSPDGIPVRVVDVTQVTDVTLRYAGSERCITGNMRGNSVVRFRVTVPDTMPLGKMIYVQGTQHTSGPRNRKIVLSATPDGPSLPGLYSQMVGPSFSLVANTRTDDPTIAEVRPGSTVFVRVTNENEDGTPSMPAAEWTDVVVDFTVYA